MDSSPRNTEQHPAVAGAPEEIAASLLEPLEELLAEVPENLGVETDLFAQGLDSMGIMQLFLVIEEQFGVQLGPKDVTEERFKSALAIARVIDGRREVG